MKKFNILMLAMIVGLLSAFAVYAADYSTSHPSSSMGVEKNLMSGEFHSFNASDLIGKTVKGKDGESLGKVEDVMLSRDGTASFVILSYGGTAGIGSKYVPIPFNTFVSDWTNMARLSTDSDVIANLDKAKLDSAPSFSDKKELGSHATRDTVCRYFGEGACPHRM